MPIEAGPSETRFMPGDRMIIEDGDSLIIVDHTDEGRVIEMTCISDSEGGEMKIQPLDAVERDDQSNVVIDDSLALEKRAIEPNTTRTIRFTGKGMEEAFFWYRHCKADRLSQSLNNR